MKEFENLYHIKGTTEYSQRASQRPDRWEEPQELINFCLNCTKKSCVGNCEEYQNFRRMLRKRKHGKK